MGDFFNQNKDFFLQFRSSPLLIFVENSFLIYELAKNSREIKRGCSLSLNYQIESSK
jgi:hypothetical protein